MIQIMTLYSCPVHSETHTRSVSEYRLNHFLFARYPKRPNVESAQLLRYEARSIYLLT